MKQRGFTVIELMVVIVVLITLGGIFFVQKNTFESSAHDSTRRSAINAMYYDLEDVFYATNHFYPKTLDQKTMTAMDPKLLSDPNGRMIGTSQSDYRYEPSNCSSDGKCKGYSLRAKLQDEADFIKTSRHR